MRCSTVARQVCASALRGSTSVASTSRPVLRAAVVPACTARRLAARAISTTFPHPDLDPSKGASHFVIRSFAPIPTIAHALAMMRAVEERLGPIISMDVPKDEDTRKPLGTIFITLLRPVQFDEPLTMEVPAPVLSRQSRFPGGPTLDDISAVLRHTTPTDASSAARGASGQMLQFNVELRKSEPRGTAAPQVQRVNPTPAEEKEDDAIVRALEAFDGGFAGGLAGVADKFQELKIERAPVAPKPVEEVVEKEEVAVPEPVAKPVEEPVDEVKSAEEPAPVAAKPKAAPLTRAERMRLQAVKAARAAAAHQKKAEEEATAAPTDAPQPEAEAEAQTAAQEDSSKPKQGGLFSSLFGRKQ